LVLAKNLCRKPFDSGRAMNAVKRRLLFLADCFLLLSPFPLELRRVGQNG
jgi:hypothetical protein